MSQQLSFEEAPRYHGPGVTAADAERFGGQKGRIYAAMKGGKWFTLRELSAISGALETSVSIRVREFSSKHGIPYEKKRAGKGLWLYRLTRD